MIKEKQRELETVTDGRVSQLEQRTRDLEEVLRARDEEIERIRTALATTEQVQRRDGSFLSMLDGIDIGCLPDSPVHLRRTTRHSLPPLFTSITTTFLPHCIYYRLACIKPPLPRPSPPSVPLLPPQDFNYNVGLVRERDAELDRLERELTNANRLAVDHEERVRRAELRADDVQRRYTEDINRARDETQALQDHLRKELENARGDAEGT